MNTTTTQSTPETNAALVDHMPKDATEWSEHHLPLSIHARNLQRERQHILTLVEYLEKMELQNENHKP